MPTLNNLLDGFRNAAATEREKGTYFEELICTYLRNEAIYRDLYSDLYGFGIMRYLPGRVGMDSSCPPLARYPNLQKKHY
jgi:predicted helicase